MLFVKSMENTAKSKGHDEKHHSPTIQRQLVKHEYVSFQLPM